MILHTVPNHSSNLFTWKGNSGVADVSDLGQSGNFKVWDRIYDDACDIGFYIVSAKTRKRVLFYMGKIDGDGEDIHGWNFISACGQFKILVVND